MQQFSVLMSIYYKEKTEYFNSAMKSIWDEQTIKPDEIVLVQDGPLNDELYSAINKWKDKLQSVLKVIPLETNVGLGDALNEGMKYCSYELIARMDTDDISLPERFEKQLEIFRTNAQIDICSSWISEFDTDENEIISYRKLPEHHNEIIQFAKQRNPLNHPATMYKKREINKADGYKKMLWFEDYYLWIRMILQGAEFYNIQEPLVHMRAGYGQLERRSGLPYAKNEFKLLKEFKQLGFLSTNDFIKNILLKMPIRLMPLFIVKRIYKLLRKKSK